MLMNEWLNAEEAAKYLGIKYVTLRAWLRQKKIQGYQVGRLWKFKVSDLNNYIESCKNQKNPLDYTLREASQFCQCNTCENCKFSFLCYKNSMKIEIINPAEWINNVMEENKNA